MVAQINLINELELCVYEFHVLTNTVCSIPNFIKKPNNLNIYCNPVVSPSVYEKYIKRKEDQEAKKTQKALLNTLLQKPSAKQADNSVVDTEQSQIDTSNGESNRLFDEVMIEDEISSLDEIADDLEQQQQQENLEFIGKNEKLGALNEQLQLELARTEDTISSLKENAKKFEQIVSKVKESKKHGAPIDHDQTQEQIDQAHQVLADSVDKFNKNDELLDKITKSLSNIIEEFQIKENNQNVELQSTGYQQLNADESIIKTRDLKEVIEEILAKEKSKKTELESSQLTNNDNSDKIDGEIRVKEQSQKVESNSEFINNDNVNEDPNNWKMKVSMVDPKDLAAQDETEKDERIKELERKLAQKLAGSDKIKEKFKTDKITVKIITLDKTETGELKQIGDAESEGLSALISSLFENNKQKLHAKRLRSNYRQVYTEENIDKVSMPGSTGGEDALDDEEDGVLFDAYDDEFTLEPNENEKDKELIVY